MPTIGGGTSFRATERLLGREANQMTTTAENKDLVRRFIQCINDHDVDALASFVADDVVNHAAIPEAQGVKGLRTIFTKIFTAMPDYRTRCEDLVAEGDRVMARVSVRGTQTGPLAFAYAPLPATGRTVETEAIHVMRIASGRIVEHWAGRDDIGMLRQLGHLPFAKQAQ
jgi:steroid delta-isomerase-like uncharacterized protein